MVDKSDVAALFRHLAHDPDRFFEKVADDVHWTVKGTHPLAGEYHGKARFRSRTFARLNRLLKDGVSLDVNHILVDGDEAAVELTARSTAKNGAPFHNTYCWIARFHGERIVAVRAYLDSALVQKLIDENESTG